MDETPSGRDLSAASSAPHFFETPAHRAAVERGAIAGAVALKHAYSGSSAFTHDSLARSGDYQSVIGPTEHEVQAFRSAGTEATLPLQIAEIGPGNGIHSVDFLEALRREGFDFRSFLALDFSATLLGMACKHITGRFGPSRVVAKVWDIEDGPSECIEKWRAGDQPVLVCILGHTLGNVESSSQTLTHIWSSLRPDDLMLAGLTLYRPGTDPATILDPYRSDTFRRAAIEPLLAVGFAAEDLEFHLSFENETVLGHAVLVRSVRIGVTTLPPGHTVRCFQSRRYTMDSVPSLFEDSGWTMCGMAADDTSEHLAVLISRGAR